MIRFVAAVLTILTAMPAAADEIAVGDPPDWVVRHDVDVSLGHERGDADSGVRLLLLDKQRNLFTHETYVHTAYKVLNQEGVANASDPSFEFDDAYQTLTFHHLRIRRGTDVLERLDTAELRVMDREPNMNVGVYEGHCTAVAHLSDVRPGDVVEYALTLRGENPVLADHVLLDWSQRMDMPVAESRWRALVPRDLELTQRLLGDGQAPSVRETPEGREYSWRGVGLDPTITEPLTPYWLGGSVGFELSSFKDWEEVAGWALPLYRLTRDDLASVADRVASLAAGVDTEEAVNRAIRFVQDDVRYLGLEDGLWAMTPRRPESCLDNRYGDCKDKSRLLTALLRAMEIDAYPVLVSTRLRESVADHAPSPTVFDHCIVGIDVGRDTKYVDPTITHQGGDLWSRHTPAYGLGLPVRAGNDGLVEMPPGTPARIDVENRFTVDAVGDGGMDFTVTTVHSGKHADSIRGFLAGAPLDAVTRQYESFYSRTYPGIEAIGDVVVEDEDRFGANEVKTIERYRIEHAWSTVGDDFESVGIDFPAMTMYQYVDMASSPARDAPYHAGPPVAIGERLLVTMPEAWPLDYRPGRIAGPGYAFREDAAPRDETIEVTYEYERSIEAVPADATASFLSDHKAMTSQLGVAVTHSPGLGSGAVSPTAVIIVVVTLLAAFALAFLVARRYDPPARSDETTPLPIRGWLLLVGLGLGLSTVINCFDMTEVVTGLSDLLGHDSLPGIKAADLDGVRALVLSEFFVGAMQTAWVVLLLVLFFARRTSFPRLYLWYLIFAAVVTTVDSVASAVVVPQFADMTDLPDVARGWFTLLIWGMYITQSERVRDTYVVRARRTVVRDVRPTEDAAL